MSNAFSADLYLQFVSGSGQVDNAFHLNVSFDGGKTVTPFLVDSGSPWLNVGAQYLPDGLYTVCDPQPPFPPPNYNSDGKTYVGQWVTANVAISGANGASFSNKMTVFRSTDPSSVSMLGISTRFIGDDALVAALQVPQILNGSYPPGYILDASGIYFGYPSDVVSRFITAPVASNEGQRTALANVILEGPPGRYSNTLPFLMDTGIDYAILTPSTEPNAPTPPDPAKWGTTQLVGNVELTITFPGAENFLWQFNTTQCGTGAAFPAYARLGQSQGPSYGIVNTGRHFLARYSYLVQLEQPKGGFHGLMGFLPV